MKTIKLLQYVSVIPACFLVATTVDARQTTLSGGISAGYDYFDRSYDTSSAGLEEEGASSRITRTDEDYSRLVLTPSIKIVSASARDSAELGYAPSFLYDLDESETDVNQRLNLNYQRSLQHNWQFFLSDIFVDTDEFNTYATAEGAFDEPEETTEYVPPGADDVLRDEAGRRRYYRNNFNLSSSYAFSAGTSMSLGYSWDILRNDETEALRYEDYDKHSIYLAAGHRINSRWSVKGNAGYTRGLYDTPTSVDTGDQAEIVEDLEQDLHQYSAGISADAQFVQHHPVTFAYAFSAADYDSTFYDDSQVHDFTLGWRWISSPQLEVSLGAGPTFTTQDNADDKWNANGYFNVLYKTQRSNLIFSAVGGVDYENFSGTRERGFVEYWQTRADYRYTLQQNLSVSFYAYYRDETREEITEIGLDETSGETVAVDFGDVGTQQLAGGCSLSYTFKKDYSVDLSYKYVQHQADRDYDEYDDHRFLLTVSYYNDFFRW